MVSWVRAGQVDVVHGNALSQLSVVSQQID